MKMKYVLGCDPDTKNTALALMDYQTEKVIRAWVVPNKTGGIESQAKILDQEGIVLAQEHELYGVLESQRFYPKEVKGAPQTIVGKANRLLKLAQSTGITMAFMMRNCKSVDLVLPSDWKGTMKKRSHQLHGLRDLGYTDIIKHTDYCTVPPEQMFGLNSTEQKHVVDAVLLAVWKIREMKFAYRKADTLKSKNFGT